MTSYVFGSKAILGHYPEDPESLRQSAEADIAPVKATNIVDLIDGKLGELSLFHGIYGFYVHGVPIDTSVLPTGREERAIDAEGANRSATPRELEIVLKHLEPAGL